MSEERKSQSFSEYLHELHKQKRIEAEKSLQDGFEEVQKRGVPVQINAFDCHHIHKALVSAYDEILQAQKAMQAVSLRIDSNRSALYRALYELEIRISDQEMKSGIGGTAFRVYRPLDGGKDEHEE